MSSVTVSKVSGALLLSQPDWVPQSARNYVLHKEKGVRSEILSVIWAAMRLL